MKDIEQQVCENIQERQKRGIQKYGTSVADNPLELKQWIQHAYEECLDQAIYLKRAMVEIESQRISTQRMLEEFKDRMNKI